MSNLINTLVESQLRIFAQNYKSTAYAVFYNEEDKKLRHPGEYGALRESLVRELLSNFLPEIYGISHGFIISPDGTVSNQCDIIIYYKPFTPVIRTPEAQRFFPVESVVAVVEVKSDIDSGTLRNALTKLVKVKQMRAKLREPAIARRNSNVKIEYNPHHCCPDQLGTFVIGEKISCKTETVRTILEEVTQNSHYSYRVNLIASIDDYCTVYKYKRDWMYPIDPIIGQPLNVKFRHTTSNDYAHLKLFLRYLLEVLQQATVIYPEWTDYFENLDTLKDAEERGVSLFCTLIILNGSETLVFWLLLGMILQTGLLSIQP